MRRWLYHHCRSGLWEWGKHVSEQGKVGLSAFSKERWFELEDDYCTCTAMVEEGNGEGLWAFGR